MFQRAIVRAPSANFAAGLTTVELGVPDYARALAQHEAYCAALVRCRLTLTRLEPDNRYPDSTFVEDTAVLAGPCCVVCRPGATSRVGEVTEITEVLAEFFPQLHLISEPGTLDGGDICEAGNHFLIGISERTNEAGAEQLARMLAACNYTSSFVDIRGVQDILHLKSGLAALSNGKLAVIEALCDHQAFRGCDVMRVPPGEEYAANFVQVNDYVLVAAGFPNLEQMIREQGYQTLTLDMSEFQKMDGGLSCLSLRF